jgi:hypothetical protein
MLRPVNAYMLQMLYRALDCNPGFETGERAILDRERTAMYLWIVGRSSARGKQGHCLEEMEH